VILPPRDHISPLIHTKSLLRARFRSHFLWISEQAQRGSDSVTTYTLRTVSAMSHSPTQPSGRARVTPGASGCSVPLASRSTPRPTTMVTASRQPSRRDGKQPGVHSHTPTSTRESSKSTADDSTGSPRVAPGLGPITASGTSSGLVRCTAEGVMAAVCQPRATKIQGSAHSSNFPLTPLSFTGTMCQCQPGNVSSRG